MNNKSSEEESKNINTQSESTEEANVTDPQKEEVSEFDKIKTENEKLRNEYLYLRAEFDNFRKNSIKERSELIKYGPERMANALLNVVDIFEKALETKVDQDNLDEFIKGIHLTASEFKTTLKNFGVNEVESLGQPFDPNLHEALGSEESTETPEGHILQVFKKPYKFQDKIMRHGQVIIAKSASPKENPSSEQ